MAGIGIRANAAYVFIEGNWIEDRRAVSITPYGIKILDATTDYVRMLNNTILRMGTNIYIADVGTKVFYEDPWVFGTDNQVKTWSATWGTNTITWETP